MTSKYLKYIKNLNILPCAYNEFNNVATLKKKSPEHSKKI